MIARAELVFTTNETASFAFDTDQVSKGGKADFETAGSTAVSFCIRRGKAPAEKDGIKYGADEMLPIAISFTPSADVKLKEFRLIFDVTLQNTLPTKYFDENVCTNAFVTVKQYNPEETDSVFQSRDLFISQNEKLTFCAAFATFRRFYTRFNMKAGNLVAGFALEDRTVTAGVKYDLEELFVNTDLTPGVFFETYTRYLEAANDIPKFKYIPRGWSQWSCYYHNIDENKTLSQAKMVANELMPFGADLIQLDDGWQVGTSFYDYWTTSEENFPSGLESLAKKISDMNLRFGLWIAPGLLSDQSPKFTNPQDNAKLLKNRDGKDEITFGNVYPYDIGREDVINETRAHFRRCMDKYKASYFKIDFITNLVGRIGKYNEPLEYESDYTVAVYKKWTEAIRDEVGPDVFLLACGAPIGESVGIFDAIRVSPDISWGGAGENGLPTAYEIIAGDVQNAIRRSYFHRRVFINDPDALIVRGYQTEYCNDSVNLSDSEAKLWATNVYMCGGHVLLNEDYYKLSEDRKTLVKRTMQLSAAREAIDGGCAARPKDLMEMPYSTECFVAHAKGFTSEDLAERIERGGRIPDGGNVIVAMYNFGGETVKKSFRVADYFENTDAEYIACDVWTDAESGKFRDSYAFDMEPHSAVCVTVRKA